MSARTLRYLCLGDTPTIFANVINPTTGKPQLLSMLVDTGASKTCFPASWARILGHDNSDSCVKTTKVTGVGGTSKAFVHNLRLELIDPDGEIWSKLIAPWRSPVMPVLFLDRMLTECGLLGRDIISRWKRLEFQPASTKLSAAWRIQITL